MCEDAGEALGDSLYEARIYVRGSVAALGADCIEKEMREEHVAQLRDLLDRAGVDDVGADEFRRYGSARAALHLQGRQRRGVLMMTWEDKAIKAGWTPPGAGWHPGLRESYLYDRNVIAEIQRAAREGIYDIRGFGAKRRLPHFDDLLFLGASMSRYPLEGYRERCDTTVTLGARHAEVPLELKIPITIAGMSFGALSAPGQGGARARRERGRHVDDDGRRRHDAGGARPLGAARLPAAARRATA